jgi:hypothetical protein
MEYVFSQAACSFEYDGRTINLTPDQVWDANDPVVVAHPDLFAAAPLRVHRTVSPVEEATAAPGQKRARRAS